MQPAPQGHVTGVQGLSLAHDVEEVVEGTSVPVPTGSVAQGPAKGLLGIVGLAEVGLGEGDGDEAAPWAQHPAHLRQENPQDGVGEHSEVHYFGSVPRVPITTCQRPLPAFPITPQNLLS